MEQVGRDRPVNDTQNLLILKAGSLLSFGWLGLTSIVRSAEKSSRTRIAFGSCAFQWVEQPIWDGINATRPDLFLFLGDAIYGDWHGEKPFVPTEESLQKDWQTLGEKPGFQALRQRAQVMATWDNHDYGTHNGGAEFSLKDVSKRLFLDFFDEPEDSERRSRSGIYESKVFGPPGRRVQVVLLDTRYFKGPFVKDPRSKEEKSAAGLSGSLGNYLPNRDPKVSLLGSEQWNWLEKVLSEPADVRIIASSTQIIPDQKGMDEWGNYPLERERLFALIKNTGAKPAVLLSGNVHFSEISQLTDLEAPLVEFTSSGMTHNDEPYSEYPNPYRIAGPYKEKNFGLVDINWSDEGLPSVVLSARDTAGNSVFEHHVSFD